MAKATHRQGLHNVATLMPWKTSRQAMQIALSMQMMAEDKSVGLAMRNQSMLTWPNTSAATIHSPALIGTTSGC